MTEKNFSRKRDIRSKQIKPIKPAKKEEPKELRLSRRQLFIIIGIAVVLIAVIFTVPYYQNYVAPFNRTVITVENNKISMRYFLERTRLAGADPMAMLQTLTEEEIIKIITPSFGIYVTNEDVDRALRYKATDGEYDMSEIEFKEWYRQLLNENKATDAQYREILAAQILRNRLYAYLSERTPDVAPQVHLHLIAIKEYEEAQKVYERLKNGEDFAAVAKEVSIDTTKDNGGDAGWVPPETLSSFQDQIAALEPGGMTGPLAYYSDTTSSSSTGTVTPDCFYIFMVSEKDDARKVTNEQWEILKSQALDKRLQYEQKTRYIRYNFNSEIYSWINYQLKKTSSSSSESSTSSSSSQS